MDTDRMFTLADRLRTLRDEKAEADKRLKEIMAIIKITDNNQRAETSVGNQGTIPEPKHE